MPLKTIKLEESSFSAVSEVHNHLICVRGTDGTLKVAPPVQIEGTTDNPSYSYDLTWNQTLWKLGECLDKLNELGENNMVTLLWIPGHTGIEGNEIEDELAKRGTEIPFWGPEPFCGISPNVILGEIAEKKRKFDHWKYLLVLGQSKIFLGDYNLLSSNECISESRTALSDSNGTLSPEWAPEKSQNSGEECRFCGKEEETSIHILPNCTAFQNEACGYPKIPPGNRTKVSETLLRNYVEVRGHNRSFRSQ